MLIFAARGEGPFGGGDTAALLYRVVHGTANLDQIPDKIQPLVSRCLSRDAARRPTAAEFLTELTAAYPSAADLSEWLPAGILELSPGRAAEAEPVAYEGLANSGNASPPPTQTAKSPVPVATQSVPQAYQGAQAYQTPQGYQGPAGYQAPRGYPGQAGPGGQECARGFPGRRTRRGGGPSRVPDRSSRGRAAAAGGRAGGAGERAAAGPRGGPEVRPPMPYPSQPPYGAQPPYPGQPDAPGSQWYSPPMQPGPRRRRRWPWAVGAVAAVVAVIVAAAVLSLGSSHTGTSAGGTTSPRPGPTTPRATPTPTLGELTLSQLRVGDCLTGANMKLNTTDPWPDLTLAVPCNQPHTAEVFFVDNKFWRQNSPFPGNSTISKDGNAACNNAFRAYVGVAYSKSIYTWTNIIPDASTWPTGDRALHCVAYYSAPQRRAGATLTHSLKGARR